MCSAANWWFIVEVELSAANSWFAVEVVLSAMKLWFAAETELSAANLWLSAEVVLSAAICDSLPKLSCLQRICDAAAKVVFSATDLWCRCQSCIVCTGYVMPLPKLYCLQRICDSLPKLCCLDVNLVITWSHNPHTKTPILGKPSKSSLIEVWHKYNSYLGTSTIRNGKPPPKEYWFMNEKY